MNLVISQGRFTKDPIVYGEGNDARVKFNLGLDRHIQRSNKNAQTADFPSYVAWGKTAETIGKYFKKGDRICITGHIATGSYISKAGQRVYTQDVVVDRFEFVDARKKGDAASDVNDFVDIADEIDEEAPFN